MNLQIAFGRAALTLALVLVGFEALAQSYPSKTVRIIKERLASQAYEPIGGTPEKFARAIGSDIERYGKVIREAGIKAD